MHKQTFSDGMAFLVWKAREEEKNIIHNGIDVANMEKERLVSRCAQMFACI